MKVAIIGGGVMGEAILGAAIDAGVFDPSHVVVCEKLEPRREQLAHVYRVEVTDEGEAAMDGAGFVLLSVKPQDLGTVHGILSEEALLLSIMAGVRVSSIHAAFHHERIVRVMPNTPVAARAGMSVWTATPAVSEEQREMTRGLLHAIGREIYVDDEVKLDAATALSGSGPAYVFLFMEALVEAGVAVGLTRAQAEEMVTQTVYGSAVYAVQSGHKPSELRAAVTSPAGTTAAGLLELERAAFRAALIDCVQAAYERSIELGTRS